MDKSREELEKGYAEATAKMEQYQHKGTSALRLHRPSGSKTEYRHP